jgi:hypothetical protein
LYLYPNKQLSNKQSPATQQTMSTPGQVIIETEVLGKAVKFIEGLKQNEKDTAYAMIRLLEKPPYDPGLVKIVDKRNRVYEVRGATKDFWIRLFWFYHKIPHKNRSVIVITNGYLKQQNKTDPNEIETASRIQSLYEIQKQEEYKKFRKERKK